MLSNFPSRKHRLDVAAVRDNCGCIKFSLHWKLRAVGLTWGFSLADYNTGEGFHYELKTLPEQLALTDGVHTFLELKRALQQDLIVHLDVHWFGTNFLPVVELVGLAPPINLPALTLPETTHLCATVDLPAEFPAIRLNRWCLETTEGESSAEDLVR